MIVFAKGLMVLGMSGAVASGASGLGGLIIILAAAMTLVGAATFLYGYFRAKGSEISNQILRDLADDLQKSLSHEKEKNADLRDEYEHLKEHNDDD